MKIRAIIQARTGSTRLPGKVLAELGGATMLEHVIVRAKAIRGLDGPPIVATTSLAEDDQVAAIARESGLQCFRGATDDVLGRFYAATVLMDNDIEAVLRITADCPLLSPELNSLLVTNYRNAPCDYLGPSAAWPNGLLQEIITTEALGRSRDMATSSHDREHVITYVTDHPDEFSVQWIGTTDLSVDTQADLDRIAPAFA